MGRETEGLKRDRQTDQDIEIGKQTERRID
jgi:hypothetical protein